MKIQFSGNFRPAGARKKTRIFLSLRDSGPFTAANTLIFFCWAQVLVLGKEWGGYCCEQLSEAVGRKTLLKIPGFLKAGIRALCKKISFLQRIP